MFTDAASLGKDRVLLAASVASLPQEPLGSGGCCLVALALLEQGRPYRWEPTPQHWRELEDRLQRWGGISSWKRLEQLGEVARIE